MKKNSPGAKSALRARVERTLALNRKARLNFPGVFLEVTGEQLGDDGVRLQLYDDPLFLDGRGELSWVAIGVLADLALGAATRVKSGTAMRPATVHIGLQMTGAPVRGAVTSQASFFRYAERTQVKQAFSTGTLRCGDALVAHAVGAFVMLDLPEGSTQVVRPWVPETLAREPLEAVEFDEAEREAIRMCRRAEKAATAEHPFIEHFWCGLPTAGEGKAQLAMRVSAHLGNRVRHAHGGVLLGTAAYVASAAAPGGMRLSNIGAYFISPGLPPRLKVRSKLVQQGRNLAVVRTQILGAEGRLVLEATSQHVAAGSS
ncbi:MAG: PaaI family thioesterase [Burkholderiales bacterium]